MRFRVAVSFPSSSGPGARQSCPPAGTVRAPDFSPGVSTCQKRCFPLGRATAELVATRPMPRAAVCDGAAGASALLPSPLYSASSQSISLLAARGSVECWPPQPMKSQWNLPEGSTEVTRTGCRPVSPEDVRSFQRTKPRAPGTTGGIGGGGRLKKKCRCSRVVFCTTAATFPKILRSAWGGEEGGGTNTCRCHSRMTRGVH